MKKSTVIIISAVLILSFTGLVYWGIRHSRGIPTAAEDVKRPVIEAPFIDAAVDLNDGIASEPWDELDAVAVDMLYQVTALPWPRPRDEVTTVDVKAFHNGGEIYFYLSWKDDAESRTSEINRFCDAVAIMFPLGTVAPHSIMMGFLGKANIWHWKASWDMEYWRQEPRQVGVAYADYYYPFEDKETLVVSLAAAESAASELLAAGVGTVTLKDTQNVSGRGLWKDGRWQVVLKRRLEAVNQDTDADFKRGARLCAFAIWDGAKGDRGGRKIISNWVELSIK